MTYEFPSNVTFTVPSVEERVLRETLSLALGSVMHHEPNCSQCKEVAGILKTVLQLYPKVVIQGGMP